MHPRHRLGSGIRHPVLQADLARGTIDSPVTLKQGSTAVRRYHLNTGATFRIVTLHIPEQNFRRM
jgi:hypothetical protein